MALVNHVEIAPLTCIEPSSGIEICPIDASDTAEFRGPSSHETNLVQIAPGAVEDLLVHHFQTDQLIVVRGSAVLVILQNRSYQYIWMSERDLKVVRVPPGIPHGGINLSAKPCIAVNSVIRHGPPHPRDYRPVKRDIPYDLTVVRALLEKL